MSQQIPKQKTQPKLQINNKTSYKMPTHKGNILVVSFGTQIELPETETVISISWEIIKSLVGFTEILGKESNFMFNTLADAEEGPARTNAFTCFLEWFKNTFYFSNFCRHRPKLLSFQNFIPAKCEENKHEPVVSTIQSIDLLEIQYKMHWTFCFASAGVVNGCTSLSFCLQSPTKTTVLLRFYTYWVSRKQHGPVHCSGYYREYRAFRNTVQYIRLSFCISWSSRWICTSLSFYVQSPTKTTMRIKFYTYWEHLQRCSVCYPAH